MLVNIFFIIFFLFIINKFIICNALNNYLVNKSLDLIYTLKIYTGYHKKYLNKMKFYLKSIYSKMQKNLHIIDHSGAIILKYEFNEFRNLNNFEHLNNCFVFYKIQTYNNNLLCKSIRRLDDYNILLNSHDLFNKSNIKLLVPTIVILDKDNNTKEVIDLTIFLNENNFYFVDNILFDKLFTYWYLKKYNHYAKTDVDSINYKINFINNDMENVTLNKNEGIKLDIDKYYKISCK